MEDNTFQTQLEEFFGGSTGGALGPDIKSSYLEGTQSDIFSVGQTAETLGKGVEIYAVPGAGPPESALIDFHSKNNPGNQIFDVRIEATGGENNVFGRGSLNTYANIYGFNGNTVNATPEMWFFGDVVNRPVPIVPSVNQGRMMATQQIVWTGTAGNDAVNPVITIQLRNPVSLTPYFGVFDVYMSSTYAGVNRYAQSPNWQIYKNASPPSDINEYEPARNGPALTVLYPEADWNVGGFPQFKLFNKGAGSTFVYMIKGTIFPENDGF